MKEKGSQSPEVQPAKSEFVVKLERLWEKGNFVCVGLDSDFDQLPHDALDNLREKQKQAGFVKDSIAWRLANFNIEIIEATHDLVCAYKPNIAFYEAQGVGGLDGLKETIEYIKVDYPEIPVILDEKRGDIGNTNLGYVKEAFEYFNADAVTVNPYLGKEALRPFLDRKDKGIIVLVRTSNPGAGEFQDLPVGLLYGAETDFILENAPEIMEKHQAMAPVWAYVAASVALNWNENGNCGVVVGATYPQELEWTRKIVGDMPILIPGIGAQGGEVEATVKAGMDSRKQGMIINSSRGIIFASKGEDFAQAARREAERLREEINKYR